MIISKERLNTFAARIITFDHIVTCLHFHNKTKFIFSAPNYLLNNLINGRMKQAHSDGFSRRHANWLCSDTRIQSQTFVSIKKTGKLKCMNSSGFEMSPLSTAKFASKRKHVNRLLAFLLPPQGASGVRSHWLSWEQQCNMRMGALPTLRLLNLINKQKL